MYKKSLEKMLVTQFFITYIVAGKKPQLSDILFLAFCFVLFLLIVLMCSGERP